MLAIQLSFTFIHFPTFLQSSYPLFFVPLPFSDTLIFCQDQGSDYESRLETKKLCYDSIQKGKLNGY